MVNLCLLAFPLIAAAELPPTMRAGALTKRPTDHQVHVEDFKEVVVTTPQAPGAGQVLIKVAGASLNPYEWKEIEGGAPLSWKFPHVAGSDFGGTVKGVGPGVSHVKAGDAVWGLGSGDGAHAEYMVTDQTLVGLAPNKISLAEAAVLPLAALTDLMGFRVAKGPWATGGKTVVVLGGSGGTGHAAIQLAKAWGASKVITTCGTSNIEFCKSQGADMVIDYHEQNWQEVVEANSVDFVYDTVSADSTGNLAYKVLKDNGTYVCLLGKCLAEASVAKARPSIRQAAIYLGSAGYTHKDLDVLRDLVDAGKLRPHVQRTFALSEVDQLFAAISAGHTVGKSSIVPSNRSSVHV